MSIVLSESQIMDLARPFAMNIDIIKEFYRDPKNKKSYRDWYIKKYGCEPPKDDIVNFEEWERERREKEDVHRKQR